MVMRKYDYDEGEAINVTSAIKVGAILGMAIVLLWWVFTTTG